MTQNNTTKKPSVQVITLDIDANGTPTQQLTDVEKTLDNTLLSRLYPGIKVAIVNLPQQFLDQFEESEVENAMTTLVHDDVLYKCAGGSNAAKEYRYYFVDSNHAPSLAKRFQFWPQAAMAYFGILVSDCKVVIENSDISVLVVKDHVLGTNDSSGFVSWSLFKEIRETYHADLYQREFRRLELLRKGSLPEGEKDRELTQEERQVVEGLANDIANKQSLGSHSFYQFRLAFAEAQAKGAFKIMGDDVAEIVGADIVLPESAVKPGLTTPTEHSAYGDVRRIRGPIVLGIRDFSRPLEYESSYTLIQHAPDDSIQLEIIPEARRVVKKVNDSIKAGDYKELLDLLGLRDPEKAEDSEFRVVEAALLADATGDIVKHPHIHNQLNRLLADWAFKTATGGGFRLPAFALAHDGYLVAHNGRVFAGSDWIPRDQAIVALESKAGLCVRYPIRMIDDLLPVTHMGTAELMVNLTASLDTQGCDRSYELAQQIASQQLLLEATYVLHSETAKKNGGDYDFDWICVLEEGRFPRFMKKRLNLTTTEHQEKDKKKARSPWLNLEHVAVRAGGNRIGQITDLITSCLAAGREDLARELVVELQAALDSLKHDTQPDKDVIEAIRKEVKNAAPWLRFKHKERVSDLKLHLEVAETDRIGKLYNHVRKEIEDLLTAKLDIEEFKGLITGEKVTREMFEECRFVNQVYAAKVGSSTDHQNELQADFDKAQAAWEAFEQDPQKELRKHQRLGRLKAQTETSGPAQNQWALQKDPEKELRKQLRTARKNAQSALYQCQKDGKEQMNAIISYIRVWAGGKTENRMGWCQALHRVVCNGRGSGSILFYAFPQEVILKLAQRTGGTPVRVSLPDTKGKSIRHDPEGRVFVIEQQEDGGQKELFTFQFQNGQFTF
jgi:hypothetical protein